MATRVLDGKIALVTGASKGIGKACARALALDGATIVVMGRGEDALAKARAEIAEEAGVRVEMVVGDASQEDEVKTALAFANGLTGHLDILVPTVGTSVMQPLLMREAASVRSELETNFFSVFLMVRHGVPLLERNGTIVCISTTAVTQAFWGLGLYGATKAAVDRFVRAAALELGSAGIRINAVRPGYTQPRSVSERPEMAASIKRFADETALGRVGEPNDIARVVRFLAGPESGWVTGQTFSVDGGMDQGKAPDMMDMIFGKPTMDRIRSGKEAQQG